MDKFINGEINETGAFGKRNTRKDRQKNTAEIIDDYQRTRILSIRKS